MKKFSKFIYSFAIVAITIYAGRYFTQYGIYNWYAQLEKPSITPPDYVFPIVWSILYFLMASSFYVILTHAPKNEAKIANQLFLSQLFLQLLWTFVFFHEGHIAFALGIIILLDIVVYKMIIQFKKTSNLATYMLYPYFWWLCYASFINFAYLYIHGMIVVF